MLLVCFFLSSLLGAKCTGQEMWCTPDVPCQHISVWIPQSRLLGNVVRQVPRLCCLCTGIGKRLRAHRAWRESIKSFSCARVNAVSLLSREDRGGQDFKLKVFWMRLFFSSSGTRISNRAQIRFLPSVAFGLFTLSALCVYCTVCWHRFYFLNPNCASWRFKCKFLLHTFLTRQLWSSFWNTNKHKSAPVGQEIAKLK